MSSGLAAWTWALLVSVVATAVVPGLVYLAVPLFLMVVVRAVHEQIVSFLTGGRSSPRIEQSGSSDHPVVRVEPAERSTAPVEADVPCPVCRDPIRERAVICPRCRTLCHEECWHYAGKCPRYGCTKVPQRPDRARRALADDVWGKLAEAIRRRWRR
ncbi:MAG: hypothetical protein HY815_29890 [Candidatus Riflebacteria bacterium]|nr:hypothetical protein [Candidatus Riflebacteria bacterium]